MDIDTKFLDPVVTTLLNVFKTMLQEEPDMHSAEIKRDDIARGIVTGFMTLESDQAMGSMAITFSKPVVADMAKKMLNADLQDIDEIARDLTGEMANIIVGGAKNILEGEGYHFSMSLPEVFAGKDHKIEHRFNGKTILVPLTVGAGDFFLEVNFKES